jgi:hypothetical protein
MRLRPSPTRRVPTQTPPLLPSLRHAEPGQILIIFALATFVLVGFVAISVDAGFLMAERRQTQSAADAGALAGAKSLLDGNTGEITAAGIAYASDNAGVPDESVVVNWPPTGGDFAGDDRYVEVLVTAAVDKFFVGAVYSGDWEVAASAVAGVETRPADYGLIALNDPGILLTGNADLSVTNGGSAMSNDDIDRNGAPNTFVTAGTIDASGSIDAGPGWSAVDGIREGQPEVPDPIVEAGITAPSVPLLPGVTTCTAAGPPADCLMSPGLYANQTVTIRRTATMLPGVYYFDDASITLVGNNAHLIGDDVLLYFTNGSTINITPGTVELSGSPSNSHIAIWVADDTPLDAGGNSDLFVEGIIYAPEAHVTLRGTGADVVHGQVFVHDLEIVGTGSMGIRYVNHIDTTQPRIFLVQ